MSASDDSSNNSNNQKRKKLGIKSDAPSAKAGAETYRAPVRGRHLPNTAKLRTKAASEARAPNDPPNAQPKWFGTDDTSRFTPGSPSQNRERASGPSYRQDRNHDEQPRRRPRPDDAGTAPRHAARRVDEALQDRHSSRTEPHPEIRQGSRPDSRPDTRPDSNPNPRHQTSGSRHQDVRHGPRGGPRGEHREDRAERQDQTLEVFFVPCPKGLETELSAELGEIGVSEVRPAPGGVAFRGNLALAWKVNLWSRLAVRVMWRISEGPYRDESDLYTAAMRIDWPRLFHVERTIAVTTLARNSPLQSLNFISLKIKDAVCDRFRSYCGERPSVETHNPDVPLVIYLTDERFSLYIDLSGEPLNRRGFRVEPAPAPLNENLAAGLLRLSGWKPGMPFFDPMMGGGTLLIEAAMMWLNRAPGLNRHFAFENLSSFDRIEWQRIRKTAEAEAHEPVNLPIFGSDIDPDMVRATGLNLKAAELFECVNILEADFLSVDAPPTDPGIIVSNPPYGVRLELEDMPAFYRGMGDTLKKRFPGWTAYFISADEQLPKTIGLSTNRRTPLYNGPLECRLYAFNIVAGSNRSKRPRTE